MILRQSSALMMMLLQVPRRLFPELLLIEGSNISTGKLSVQQMWQLRKQIETMLMKNFLLNSPGASRSRTPIKGINTCQNWQNLQSTVQGLMEEAQNPLQGLQIRWLTFSARISNVMMMTNVFINVSTDSVFLCIKNSLQCYNCLNFCLSSYPGSRESSLNYQTKSPLWTRGWTSSQHAWKSLTRSSMWEMPPHPSRTWLCRLKRAMDQPQPPSSSQA